ncbi:MAG TPA: radical SAM protein [Chitinispirillaceae bacterium]|nr:radical SAM protein [Chitinispirillaceae bacterium]
MLRISMITAEALKEKIAGRDVYLWGASIVGFGIARALERNGIKPAGFIDKSRRLKGKSSLGCPVFLPEEILGDKESAGKPIFIVITSGHYEHEIAESCIKAGLEQGKDFISAREISPLDPSVDISGICNLHCISCPRGNLPGQPKAGLMSSATYLKVLEKLLRELPFTGNIQLYTWGEPFLNPEIAQIIRMTVDRRVLCAISTNLNVRTDFSEAIKARPDWIKISVSGYGPENYERTHTGGKWPVLLENMQKLRDLKEKFNPEMYVEVNYHIYKHNTGEELTRMRDLTESLGFIFRPNYAYLYSLDNIMMYREGGELSPEAKRTLEMLLLPLDEGIRKAEMQKHLPCAEERCFPINWNLNVRFCGAYFNPVLVENFLEMPLAAIIEKRNQSPFCPKCKSLALHRFTSVYLEEKSDLTGENG